MVALARFTVKPYIADCFQKIAFTSTVAQYISATGGSKFRRRRGRQIRNWSQNSQDHRKGYLGAAPRVAVDLIEMGVCRRRVFKSLAADQTPVLPALTGDMGVTTIASDAEQVATWTPLCARRIFLTLFALAVPSPAWIAEFKIAVGAAQLRQVFRPRAICWRWRCFVQHSGMIGTESKNTSVRSEGNIGLASHPRPRQWAMRWLATRCVLP
jgi:hypothetical protein